MDEHSTKNFPSWLKNRNDISINELELVTVMVAIKLWSERIRDRNVLAYCDNASSVEVVNSGRARNRFSTVLSEGNLLHMCERKCSC